MPKQQLWQKMLKNDINTEIDLCSLKEEMKQHLPSELQQYVVEDSQLFSYRRDGITGRQIGVICL